ncbi:MAG: tetratricopeptide repeat protein [Gemmatimonadota bacterium]|nr:MAG: tetratricopeptide repeat protein [Gemmatimonadota bacterium]
MKKAMIVRCNRISIILIMLLSHFYVCALWADDSAMFKRGNDLLLEQKYSGALTAFETFVKENPEHRLTPAAKWTMANILMDIDKDYEKAARLFQGIVIENPDTDWEFYGYDRLGSVFEEQEDWGKAVKVFQTATQKMSAADTDAETQGRINGFRRRTLACYQNMNDYNSIIHMYQDILTENPAAPSTAEDQFQLAQAYLVVDNSKNAAENFSLLVERYPASNYAQQVQSQQADLLTSELSYDWTSYTTFQSAMVLGQTGQYEEALARFDEVIKIKPNTPMATGATIQKHLIEYRKTGDAAALMEKLTPDREKYPYGLAGVPQDRLNSFLGGIVSTQEALQSTPDDVGLYVRLSQFYYQTQAFKPGVEVLKKAIEIAPNTPNACNMLGYCYLGAQEYDEALSAFQKLIEINPKNPNSYDSMAEGCYQKGDTTMAIHFYQKSLATDSSFTNPYFMLGRIFHELDNKEKAVEHLEKYLELDPGGFWAPNAQMRLVQLKPTSATPSEQ